MSTRNMFSPEEFDLPCPELPEGTDGTGEYLEEPVQPEETGHSENASIPTESATSPGSAQSIDEVGHHHQVTDTTHDRGRRWLGSALSGGPYPIGELSTIFPVMVERAFASFVKDVAENGQLNPIYIWNGEIVDGKHLAWACRELDIEPVYVILPDDIDPTRFVWSKNVERRHLKPSQRAMIAAELSAWSPPGRPSKQGGPKNSAILQSFRGFTQGEAADELDVSVRLVANAAKVAAETAAGVPEMTEAVRQRVVSVSDAVQVVAEPAEVKRMALDLVRQGQVRTVVAGVEQVKEELAGRERSSSTETCPPVAFGDNVNDYHCAIADLAKRVRPESVDIIIARVPLGAKPQVFSSIASLAEHSLTHKGILVVPVYTEQLVEAVRRLAPRENDRKRHVRWFLEMDIVFPEPIGDSGEPRVVGMRRIALLVLCKPGARFFPGEDVIEVPPREDANGPRLKFGDAMGPILQQFARPRLNVCALSCHGNGTANMTTVKLRSQFFGTDEYGHYMGLIAGQLFGETQISTTGGDEGLESHLE